MSRTEVCCHINAPREAVYDALLNEETVLLWRVPDGMTGEFHLWEPREGGKFRVSLTYQGPNAAGKTTPPHRHLPRSGHFFQLEEGRLVIEVVEFETEDPELQGEMTISTVLADEAGGTVLWATHKDLPPGLSPEANQEGRQESLSRLAALLERP